MRDTPQFMRGRIGEILQYWWYVDFGVELQDLADRTEKRAPLLHGRTSIVAPDTNALKSARFFLEFKTKTHHQYWLGGSRSDQIKTHARIEQGIEARSLSHYLEAEKRWKMPVVLSILVVDEAELRAATLHQLGEARFSPNRQFPIANWNIHSFDLLAKFDKTRLHRLFNSDESGARKLRSDWLSAMPPYHRVRNILEWLKPAQQKFRDINQHIFDAVERGWHGA